MAQPGCFVCPGHAAIFVAAMKSPDANIVAEDWFKLPHTITYEIVPDVEDPTEIRTSDTDGNKVAVGSGATSYTLNVTSALAVQDWLYGYILNNDDTWGKALLGSGAELWFFLTWVEDDTPGETIVHTDGVYAITANQDNGIYARGIVQPGGYGLDNDSTDPAQAEWSVNLSWQHWPELASGTTLGDTDTDPALN